MASMPFVLALSLLLTHTHAIAVNMRQQQPTHTTEANQKQITPPKLVEPETSNIATVNSVEISLERFNRLYEARVSRLRARDPNILPLLALDIKTAIVGRLIDEALVEQEAKRQGLTVSDTDLDYALQEFGKTFPNADAFTKYLASLDAGEQSLREQLRTKILREKLAGINPTESVSDEDAKAFYEQNNFQFNIPAHLTVQDIVFLVPPNAGADIEYAQKAKAEAALGLAKKPNVSFPGLARQQSEGARAKAGGDLGQVTEQSIDPRLWNELSRLQPGQISEVIRAADGYHVLKLVSLDPEVRKSFEESNADIKANIRLRRYSAKLTELMTTLRGNAKIENHFLRRYPQYEPRPVKTKTGGVLNGGLTAQPATLTPGSAPGASPRTSP